MERQPGSDDKVLVLTSAFSSLSELFPKAQAKEPYSPKRSIPSVGKLDSLAPSQRPIVLRPRPQGSEKSCSNDKSSFPRWDQRSWHFRGTRLGKRAQETVVSATSQPDQIRADGGKAEVGNETQHRCSERTATTASSAGHRAGRSRKNPVLCHLCPRRPGPAVRRATDCRDAGDTALCSPPTPARAGEGTRAEAALARGRGAWSLPRARLCYLRAGCRC